MSNPHRGLPPPAAMSLSQPTQQPPPMGHAPLSQPMGQMPSPPQQWHGAEESMRNWLFAKAEEDKRKQEEEKTRQESLRLEQRKIEQDMLRTSLSGGIPPYMIPMVFAGMGGSSLSNANWEQVQHYMAQAHQQLQHQQQTSPEQHQRGDSRANPHPYQHPLPVPVVPVPSTPLGAVSQQGAGFPSYPLSPTSRSRQIAQQQGALVRTPQTSQLPRLNTGEMHIQPPPTGSNMQTVPGQPLHPLQQTHSAPPESSPSIYFHHWQPPSSQAVNNSSSNVPTTPSDHTSSPRKRKATGPQQAAPPPSSQPQYTSPPFSQTGSSMSNTPSSRRRGHSRQKSEMSARGLDSYGRPMSRHRHTESGFSAQSIASPSQAHGTEQSRASASAEPRRGSGGSHPLSSILDHGETHQLQPPQSQFPSQRDSQYSADSEMRYEPRHASEEEISRRVGGIKRDDGQD